MQMAAAVAVLSSSTELLMLLKAVAVAVAAPDQVLPSRARPGVAGLLCSYVCITTVLCSSLVTGMLTRWLITERGKGPTHGKAGGGDDGGGAASDSSSTPLLAGMASWERPENNKRLGGKDDDVEAAGGSGASAAGQATVLELLRLSLPDSPLLLAAFLFGSAAALAAACVPYFTGLIIDYASIDPNRCAQAVLWACRSAANADCRHCACASSCTVRHAAANTCMHASSSPARLCGHSNMHPLHPATACTGRCSG